jgi:hypothetical protein
VTKVRRGGYVFVTWVSDHPPRHVHVLRDGRLVTKWDLELDRPMKGSATPRLAAIISDLRGEGLL